MFEAKAVEKLTDAHVKQVLNYLAISKLELGLLVNFGAVDDLADKIKHLLENPALAEQFGQAGRAKVLANYTWPVVFGKVYSVYRQILKNS